MNALCRLLCLTGFAFTLTGCLGSSVHPQNGALGVEVPATTVINALTHAVAGISIANAKIGDCVTYEENYRINTDPVIMSQLIKHKLLSITNGTNTITYNLFEDYYEFQPSGAIKDEVHRQLPLEFEEQAPPNNKNLVLSDNPCNGQVRDDGDGIKYDCIRYFNLETDERAVNAPAAVKQKPNCLGFANCQIPGQHIMYDAVKYLKGQEVNKVTIEAHFSRDIPDLFYLRNSDGSYDYTEASTSFCTTTIETAPDNTKYLARFCSVLRDMNTGSTGDCLPPSP